MGRGHWRWHVWGKMESGSVWMSLAKGRWQSWQHRLLHLLPRLMGKLRRVREERAKREGIWYLLQKIGKKPESW